MAIPALGRDPGSITTLPYNQIIMGRPLSLRGRIEGRGILHHDEVPSFYS
jgi:hypothetical protein